MTPISQDNSHPGGKFCAGGEQKGTTFFTNTALFSERRFIKQYWKVQASDNGRGLFDWEAFRDAIHADPKSTTRDKNYADILVQAVENGVYDPDIYGEWHHLTPLCMFGSFELDENYVRLRPDLHVKVHAALSYFFPSYYPLQESLNFTINGGNHSRSQADVSAIKVLKKDDAWFETIGMARERAAAERSVSMEGNMNALKPVSANPVVQANRDTVARCRKRKELEDKGEAVPVELQRRKTGHPIFEGPVTKRMEGLRLGNQRKKLKKQSRLFTGNYTAEEINMWNTEHPDQTLRHY